MSFEFVTAAMGGADLCLKYGKELLEAYQAFKNAEDSIREKILTVEAMWSRTSLQVDFLRRVAPSLPEEHCRIQVEILDMLNSQFKTSVQKIDSLIKKPKSKAYGGARPASGDGGGGADRNDEGAVAKFKRLKYALVRESLDQTISSLERWQSIFDPTWFLMLRISDNLIDTELARDIQNASLLDKRSSSSPKSELSSATARSNASSKPDSMVASAKRLRSTIRDEDVGVHVSLDEDGLDWESAKAVRYSSTRIIQRAPRMNGAVTGGGRATTTTQLFAADSIACVPYGSYGYDVANARDDADKLARKLKQVDPLSRLGVLPCQGLVKRKDPGTKRLSSYALLFRLPPQAANSPPPTSLRELLVQARPSISPARRLDWARQLAEAVSFVHTCDFVHKNVRPETVLVLPESGGSTATLGAAYLLGFDSFRSDLFNTHRSGDAAWERNLYRHPLRQGLRSLEIYAMQHDVYSLGVCLLELGLWRSFVKYQDAPGEPRARLGSANNTPLHNPNSSEPRALPSAALGGLTLDDFAFDAGSSSSSQPITLPRSLNLADNKSQAIKEHLVRLARSELPSRMGGTYTAVVITCLTCLDKDNADFGDWDDMHDEDGVLIGVRFIEKVLLKLNSISI